MANELSNEEKVFYRELRAVVTDGFIHGLLVKYAQMGYNNAIKKLRTATDPLLIGRLQGEAEVYERLMNIKEYATQVVSG